MKPGPAGVDGPSLEEAVLWGDLADQAEQIAELRRELADAHATIAELRAELARLRQPRKSKSSAPRTQMGAAA